MKHLRNKIIACMLAVITTFTVTMAKSIAPVKAATAEQFLSEVALVYEDSVEDAKAAIAGTGWKLFNKDLNPNNDITIFDDGVYLVYKTSTNVEDAITDLRVMDMYGGYSATNYQKELEKSRKEYNDKMDELRIVAAEFKERFEDNDKIAVLAYRQMNYYQDVISENGSETGMLMGDYFLNFPNDNNKIIPVLFEGNATIISNLFSLLAIGISNADGTSLAERITEKYAIKDTLSDEVYHESARIISQSFETIKGKLVRYEALKEEYDFADDEMTDEEYVFLTQYATISELIKGIKYGEKTLAEFLMGNWETKDLYPIVAALTPGQKALADMGLLEVILKYHSPSKSIKELTESVDNLEESLKDENGNMPTYDVYTGVDREIFKGDFAMTTAAQRQQALTGETWDAGNAASREGAAKVAYIVAASIDGLALLVAASVHIALTVYERYLWAHPSQALANSFNAAWKAWQPIAANAYIIAFALTIIILATYGITTLYNYYNPDYLEIPNTMIDVKETDLGDKYIKYSAAKVLNGEEGQEVADFNAYEAKEWIALYYTKDANAGNCLTPNFVYRENNNTVSKRHQGVSMFGEDTAFNLNSHVYRGGATGVYLSVRYSNAKKGAVNVPSVIGSMLTNGGYYVLAVIAGIGIGVAIMAIVQHVNKKKKEETVVEQIASED